MEVFFHSEQTFIIWLTWACSSYIMAWHTSLRKKNWTDIKSVFVCVFVSVCHHPSDQVFGCGLEMLCEREKSTVPRFVRLCTAAVEKRGTVTANTQPAPANVILNLKRTREKTPSIPFWASVTWRQFCTSCLWLPNGEQSKTHREKAMTAASQREI